jgi:D-lactate dehydrogenase (cytochrome)
MLSDAVFQELAARFGDRVTRAEAVRRHHGQAEGHHPPAAPEAVLFAATTEDVVDAVRLCSRHGVPVIAFGVGSSLEGGTTAPGGGLCIDLGQMQQILAVNEEDLDCTVQAGVTREQLNAHLRDRGLFFPIDPGANATLGGMSATRASGTNAVRYGTMRENVLSLKVVLADGRVITTAKRARKSAAGYDLTRLFVGSEGTLGIITEVTVRLYPIPEAIAAATCPFATLAGAVDTVIRTIQLGVPVARIELLDEVQLRACNAYSKLGLPEQVTLFFEFHGSEAGVREQSETVAEIAAENGGAGFRWALLPEERSALWRARHDAWHACKAMRPEAERVPTDVCVPISRLAECIIETRADIDASGLVAPILGHVGDGNFHVVMLVDPDDPREIETVNRVYDRMVKRALALGGTCTGEHGIGLGKREALVDELGGDAVAVMRALKQALDPGNILNPGKILLPV